MTRKIALGIFLLAIIFFLMPWVNVSCMGTPIVSATGFDMVRGAYDIPEEASADMSAESEPLAIWALVAAAVGLIVSLFTWKIGFIMRILAGLAGIALLIALKIKIGNDFSNELPNEARGLIQINYLVGYWLTLIAFAAATVVSAIKTGFTINITKTTEPPQQGNVPPAEKPPPIGSAG